MAKRNALGQNLYVAGYDLSGDVGQLGGIEYSRELYDVTSINRSAIERIGGQRTGRLSFSGFFNDAALQEHVALKLVPTVDVIACLFHSTTLGDPACGITGKRTGYPITREANGMLRTATEILSNSFPAVEWGKSLTAGKRTDTGATNGTGVDFGTGSLAFGLVAYLHVFSFTGTDATVKLQESSDNAVADPYADVTGGGFTQITAGVVSYRIVTSLTQTVERWLRAVTVTTGGFTNLVFAVVAKRYASADAEL